MKLARETVLLAALGLADLGHTVYFIHIGIATEANPILSFYLRSGLLPFIAIKLLFKQKRPSRATCPALADVYAIINPGPHGAEILVIALC